MKTGAPFTISIFILALIISNRSCTKVKNSCVKDVDLNAKASDTKKLEDKCLSDFVTCKTKCEIKGSCSAKCTDVINNLSDKCVGVLTGQEDQEKKMLENIKKEKPAEAVDPEKYQRRTTQTCQDQYNDTKCIVSTCNSIEPAARNKLTECSNKASALEKDCQTNLKSSTLNGSNNCNEMCKTTITDEYVTERLNPSETMNKMSPKGAGEISTSSDETKPLQKIEDRPEVTLPPEYVHKKDTTTTKPQTSQSSDSNAQTPYSQMGSGTGSGYSTYIQQQYKQEREEKEKKEKERQQALQQSQQPHPFVFFDWDSWTNLAAKWFGRK